MSFSANTLSFLQRDSRGLQRAFHRWQLVADGLPFHTRSSVLQAVFMQGSPAMVKVALCEEEVRGAAVVDWWQGSGAVRVLAVDGATVLLERACGGRSLSVMAQTGQDVEATRILCAVTAQLHAHKHMPLPALVSLPQWFSALRVAGTRYGGSISDAATIAEGLLAAPQEPVVLHGDVHHGNIIDGGARGWLAIDPKGLYGERGFDYANMFCNPDHAIATRTGRFAQQVEIVTSAAGLEYKRLLAWIAAWAGLSAVWHMEDGGRAETALAIAEQALCALRC